MADSWKLTAFGDKATIQAALLAQEDAAEWDPEVVLTGFELADDRPDDWRLDAYFPRKPAAADRAAVKALFAGKAPRLTVEKLPDADWVSESQQGIEPSDEPGVTSLVIPASQAFGTGQHATTAGCLAMLTEMKRRGVVARRVADIGTGTGLLAFAALDLWPRAHAVASDIDPVCAPVVVDNAAANGFRIGAKPGQLAVAVAEGMDDLLLRACGPYDLLIANILAAPLVELAGDFAEAVPPRGHLLLAGLLATQEAAVRAAYRRAGFHLVARLVSGDWSILWLRRRFVG